MNIQSNINQGLSVASMLITMNPIVRAKAEEKKEIKGLEKQEKALKSQYKQVAGKVEYGSPMDITERADDLNLSRFTQPPDPGRAAKIEDKLQEVKEKQFELKPSSETYSKALAADYGQFEGLETETAQVRQFQENLNALAKQQEEERKAQEAMTAKQEERRKGRRKFSDYIADEPTSLGVPFGQLDPKVQQELLKSYSKAERKSIMDRKDAMNEQK